MSDIAVAAAIMAVGGGMLLVLSSPSYSKMWNAWIEKERLNVLHDSSATQANASDTTTRLDRIYIATTRHARFIPRSHIFQYPVVYVGLDLDRLENDQTLLPSWIWGHNQRFKLLSLRDEDYLTDHKFGASEQDKDTNALTRCVSIKQRLVNVLESFGILKVEMGSVELVTCPRVFGVAFNPLNVYYVFASGSSTKLRAVVLEVNNTFKERHIYICDSRNKIEKCRKGYHMAFRVARAFHVSPFNNRTGIYEVHIKNPSYENDMDVLLILKDYESIREVAREPYITSAKNSNEIEKTTEILDLNFKKRLMARVYGSAYHLTTLTVLHVLITYPLTLLMTVPRIMFEAYKLAYFKKLPVYQRPNPFNTHSATGVTVLRKFPDAFQKYCSDVFLEHMRYHSQRANICIIAHLPNYLVHTFSPTDRTKQPVQQLTLHLNSWNLPLRLVMDADYPCRALATTYVRGDWTLKPAADLSQFIKLFQATTPPNHDHADDVLQRPRLKSWRKWYHGETDAAPISNRISHIMDASRFLPYTISPVQLDATTSNQAYWAVTRGMIAVSLEESWFRMTTRFAWDPYALNERVLSMEREKLVAESGQAMESSHQKPMEGVKPATDDAPGDDLTASWECIKDGDKTQSNGNSESDDVEVLEHESVGEQNQQEKVENVETAEKEEAELTDAIDIEVRERVRFEQFFSFLLHA